MSSLTVGNIIGVGGYGSVYHAHWEGREVAIKLFNMTHAEAVNDSTIQREIQLLESLRYKHIIQFYDTTQHDGRLVLVMEYAEGGSLYQAIKYRLAWPTKTRIAEEIARGLAYIHHKGILHRDLKSMNVLLTRQLEAKLCDFGLATVLDRSSCASGQLKGTHRWMAPELFGRKPHYSTKSDMYALGMVMWEMAANCTKPFQDQPDSFAAMAIVLRGEREVLPDETPSEYRNWVERCWDQDPNQRPEASEMLTKDDEPIFDVDTNSDQSTVSITSDMCRMAISPGPSANARRASWPISRMPDDVGTLLTRASGGDADAQVALAAMYESGVGVEQDTSEAFKWYLRAAAHGSTEAHHKTGDYLRHGRGTKKDVGAALYWIREAAARGHAMAQNDLGQMYQHGEGVEQDEAETASWYRKSAEQGNAIAQLGLGSMYANGRGVGRDDVEAVSWYRKSAEQGNALAQLSLGFMYANGLGTEKNDIEAVSWYRRSAEQGNSYAQLSLGFMYANELGVERDDVEAVSWYRKAAEQGNAKAQNNLASMFTNGLGVAQDDAEAMTWYCKSAEQGNAQAQLSLGWIYENGLGVERDDLKAALWYRKSAEQGNAKAQNNLGSMYEKGQGVLKDTQQAIHWYRKAADQGDLFARKRIAVLERPKSFIRSRFFS
ncbi:hypothetical protein DFQ27_001329 [Actinomortierella ambigua]|uniref:Protein kinase domain-containing protein n=1 Tax=Actinomortierella ambigua TaxID=1343610 RepID=A0A9P6QAH1_9FUNG|nr:hypothetical protein DFQ27_001329 [Actinomortierella ambigua]